MCKKDIEFLYIFAHAAKNTCRHISWGPPVVTDHSIKPRGGGRSSDRGSGRAPGTVSLTPPSAPSHRHPHSTPSPRPTHTHGNRPRVYVPPAADRLLRTPSAMTDVRCRMVYVSCWTAVPVMLMLQGPVPLSVKSHDTVMGDWQAACRRRRTGGCSHSSTLHDFHTRPGEGWHVSRTGSDGLVATSGALRQGGTGGGA